MTTILLLLALLLAANSPAYAQDNTLGRNNQRAVDGSLTAWWVDNADVRQEFAVRISQGNWWEKVTVVGATSATNPSDRREGSYGNWKCGSSPTATITADDDTILVECHGPAGRPDVATPSNRPPSFASGSTTREFTRPRQLPYVAVNVGAPVVATDPDGDTLTYTLAGSNSFDINPSTGQITTVDGVSYDPATWGPSRIDLVVTACDNSHITDRGGCGFSHSIVVKVTINDPDPTPNPDPTPEPDPDPPTPEPDVTPVSALPWLDAAIDWLVHEIKSAR